MKLSKKKFITILTIVLLIINIIVAIFIFVDIQIIKAPITEVNIDIVEVNSEEIIIDAKLKMYNSNSFQIGLKDFVLTSMNYENEKLGELKISGGTIQSHESRVFSEREKIVFKESKNLTILKNKIAGKISVTFLGIITKIIPIEVIIITSVEKIFENLEIPDVDIEAHLTNLSEKGIEFSAKVNVYNPTSLVYNVNDLYLDFTTNKGVNVGNISIDGGSVKNKSSSIFVSTGIVKYQALDAEILILKLRGIAGARVGGIGKNVSISADASLVVPDLKELVFGGDEIDFRIPLQFKLTLKGILSNVGFSIYNPSNVSLLGDNLKCLLYRVDDEKMTLLGEKNMEKCYVQAFERVCVKTQIIIPYLKYLFSGSLKLIPDWIVLRIEGDFHIAGTRQAFPIALNAYFDPNLIKQKEFN